MKKTLTIAIPAYNEEKNIIRLLKSLYTQTNKNYLLENIEIYSDGSTDSTVDLVRKNFKDIKVLDFKENLGKNRRVNQIMKNSGSDILVQVDADTYIRDRSVLDKLVLPIIEEGVDLVCAYHVANKPKKFVGRLAYFGYKIWDNARYNLGEKGIRYYCEGGLRAFSKNLTSSLRIPEDRHMGEDSYSFYFAVANGYKVTVSKEAKVYIDLADNYKDYVLQMKRFLLEPGLMKDSFDEEIVAQYETLTPKVKLRSLVNELVRSPLIGAGYLALQSLTKLQMYFYEQPIIWQPIKRK